MAWAMATHFEPRESLRAAGSARWIDTESGAWQSRCQGWGQPRFAGGLAWARGG